MKNAFIYACENNYIKIVKMLVEVFRVEIDYKDSRGKTGFVYACEKNFLDIVKYILKINPNVIYQNNTQEQYIDY